MAPPKYKDVAKAANDLLNNDYCFDKKLKLTTKTSNGVSFTTEGVLKPKGVTGKLTSKFKPFAGISVDKLCMDTGGKFTAEATLDDAIDGVSFTVKAEDGVNVMPAGELSMVYSAEALKLNASVDVSSGPTFYGAGLCKYDNFLFGGEVKYNTQFEEKDASPTLDDYNGSIAYKGDDFTASLVTKKKASVYNVAVNHDVSKEVQVAATMAISPKANSKVLSVGGIYKLDSETKFQGKVDSAGWVSANCIQQVKPSVKLISSVSVDAKDFASDSHKFGLQLVLG